MLTTVLDQLRLVLGRPDPRTPEELERDLEDELSFHLDMLEREERDAGLDPDAARTAARDRFGDIDRIRAACRRVANEDRAMLQRVNAVLIVVLLIAVVVLGVQVHLGQRQSTLALERMQASLEALASAREANMAAAAQPAAVETAPAVVYLAGHGWASKGANPIPPGRGQVLKRLALSSGGIKSWGGVVGQPDQVTVTVDRPDTGTDQTDQVFRGLWWTGDDADPEGFPSLRAGDIVSLTFVPPTTVSFFNLQGLPSRDAYAGFGRLVQDRSSETRPLAELLAADQLLTLPPALAHVDGTTIRVDVTPVSSDDGQSESTRSYRWRLGEQDPPDVEIHRGDAVVVSYQLPGPIAFEVSRDSIKELRATPQGPLFLLSMIDRSLAEDVLSDEELLRLLELRKRLQPYGGRFPNLNSLPARDPSHPSMPSGSKVAVPAALDLSSLDALDQDALKAKLVQVARAEMLPFDQLDNPTRLRLHREFQALVQALNW